MRSLVLGDLLPNNKTVNRRIQPHEMQTEKELADIFHRPVRTFIHDMPYYPWLPKDPEKFMYNYYKVNFQIDDSNL